MNTSATSRQHAAFIDHDPRWAAITARDANAERKRALLVREADA